ncbi:glycosyl transferase family 2 domain-containing protein [Ditylenchus destructor]|uniref:Glycosyl transferase family 2 domain-containing protein n=1 Tax=Ditylenchus destructor TaxID=166010 RepID=A0AAD4NF48_9BILA|nr:glycosyl transferase family 2 domain-containing protein [Ditylenchus destructor]
MNEEYGKRTDVKRQKPEISCIVPVRNGEVYFRECLDSLLVQMFQHKFELCIYDDGSEDGIKDIITEYAPLFEAKGIGFVWESGTSSGGVGYAKNRAIDLSSGRFLCFCDADDINLPHRLAEQYALCLACEDPENCIVGAEFARFPENSTPRYIEWACSLAQQQLGLQIYTSFGPTLIAPTWFLSRALYDRNGGFDESKRVGFPEDLDFFYRAIRNGASLVKLEKRAVMYRYHQNCSSLIVNENTIWQMRVEEIQRNVLDQLERFTIWNAGKQGKKFFRSLSIKNQKKVVAMCDVDSRKIALGTFESYDDSLRQVTASIPIISYRDCLPPVVLCVKLNMTGGEFERLLSEKQNWCEGLDFFHFN